MAGYSQTPLWKKLGYKSGTKAYLDDVIDGYASMLALPAEVTVDWQPHARKGVNFIHTFNRDAKSLGRKLATYRSLVAPDGMIWISWPKKSSGVKTDITEDVIRVLALPLGLVDIKVCAVDEVWSGLKLVVRKTER